MMAFDEVWPADLPALRPLRLDLRRPCRTRVAGAATEAGVGPAGSARCKGSGKGGGRDDRPEGYGGPVFLMPMHREGKGVQGRCGVFSSCIAGYIVFGFVLEMLGGAERLKLVDKLSSSFLNASLERGLRDSPAVRDRLLSVSLTPNAPYATRVEVTLSCSFCCQLRGCPTVLV